MQDEEKDVNTKQIKNSKTADSGGKIIFEEPEFCAQLFKDYVDMDILKNVRPEEIEDVTERFIPMFTEERDADVIKKVHLSDEDDIFIALIEHKASVDYNVVMQILRYMVYIWEDYEKQLNAKHKGISKTKSFKYPPVLPIVYYEGGAEWTADMMLADRITLNEAFKDFIPNFKYYLISLRDYDKNSLIAKKDELSFVMLINSIMSAEEFQKLNLSEEYFEELFRNSSDNVVSAIAKLVSVVLRKQFVPETEIGRMVDQIKRRKPMGLWEGWHGFNVQEERRNGEEIKLIKLVCSKITKGWDVNKIADLFDEEEAHIQSIYDVAVKFAPDYDSEKIYEELAKGKEEKETANA